MVFMAINTKTPSIKMIAIINDGDGDYDYGDGEVKHMC